MDMFAPPALNGPQEFDIGSWVLKLRQDLDAQRQQQEMEKQAHVEQLVNAAKSQAQQNVAPIPGVEELIAQAQGQRRQGVPMQGGRTVLGPGGFGPNVGSPVPGAQIPIPQPPVPDEGAAIAGLLSRGFQQMDAGAVGPPGARGPGAMGIGAGGQFYEAPEQMRHSKQTFSPEQIASAKVRAGERDAELKSRSAKRDNVGEARGLARQNRRGVSPLAQMMAQTDDPGQGGEFARGAVSPQSTAIMQQGRLGAAKNAMAERELKLKEQLGLPTVLANAMSAEGTDPATKAKLSAQLLAAVKQLTGGGAVGAGEESIFGTQPDPVVTSQFDTLLAANAEDPEAFLMSVPPETIQANPEAFKAYFESKFGVGSLDSVLAQSNPTMFGTEVPDRLNQLGPLYGYQDKSKPFFRFNDPDWRPADPFLK